MLTESHVSALLLEADRVEGEAWSDLLLAAPLPLRRSLDVHVEHDGDALALVCPGIDHMLLNRLFGLGRDASTTRGRLARLLSLYRARDVERFLVHTPAQLEPPALEGWFVEQNLSRYPRDWMKFARPAGPVSPARSALRVAPLAPADRELGARLVTQAFDLPEAAAALFTQLASRPRWHLFAAYDEPRPVAVAGLYVSGSMGYLAFGATAPSHRRQGAQAKLIERRLRVAFALGARWVVSETGVASGDDPQHSYRNLQRAGLKPVALRANWIPRGAAW
jgi:hypothetical protein